MARLGDIVFDCDHPASLARFWAAALDGYEVAPYDDEEIARLAAMGVDDVEDDPSVMLLGPGPRVFCQRVPEGKSAKNRCHLDLTCDDLAAEVARLESIGATRLAHQPSDGTVAMADPAGNELCIRGEG